MGDLTRYAKDIQQHCRSFIQGGLKDPNPKYKLLIKQYVEANASDIYEKALSLMDKLYVPEDKRVFVDLHLQVLNETSTLLKSKPQVEAPLTQNTQLRALNFALRKKNKTWMTTTCEVYKVSKLPKEVVSSTIDELLKKSCYTEAAYLVIELNLQKSYDLKAILVPLLLENKVNVMEDYIKGCNETAASFVNYLDSIRNSAFKVDELVRGTKVVASKVNADRFMGKTFNKLITRLAKKYNVTGENCPNTKIDQSVQALKYLFYKRYREGGITDECFLESVHSTIEDSREVGREALNMFVSHQRIEEGRKLADSLKIPENDRPTELQAKTVIRRAVPWDDDFDEDGDEDYYDEEDWEAGGSHWEPTVASMVAGKSSTQVDWNPPIAQTSTAEVDWEPLGPTASTLSTSSTGLTGIDWNTEIPPKNDELHLRISCTDDVVFVDKPDKLEKAISDILNYDAIGLDSEWKPTFGTNFDAIQKVDLIQVATWDTCYLLDVLTLDCVNPLWKRFFSEIISSKNILKIGYGLKSDWSSIAAAFASDIFSKAENVLDLQDFTEWFFIKYPNAFDAAKNSSSEFKGLSKLAYVVLGKRLNKEEQFSNWQNRPLRPKQIEYAATDAYCLLQIYESLNVRCTELKLNLGDLVRLFLSGKVSIKDCATMGDESDDFKFPEMSIRHFRCVVDNMLHGLGRYLRISGADTEIVDQFTTREQAVQLCLQDDRIMLTSGTPYEQLKSRLPRGRCYKLPNSLNGHEQLELCIKRFNLRVTEVDLFTRCVKCNADDFEEVQSSVMRNLYERKVPRYKGIVLKYEALEKCYFRHISLFYVCPKCGYIYWEGCHHSRWKEKVKSLLFTKENPEESERNQNAANKTEEKDVEVIVID